MVKAYSRFAIAMFDHLFRVGKFGCSKLIDWYSGDWGWFLVVFLGLMVNYCIRAWLSWKWLVVVGCCDWSGGMQCSGRAGGCWLW